MTNDNYFLVGSEDGALYSGCRHGSKTGILDSYDGHHGPITGLDPHPGYGSVGFQAHSSGSSSSSGSAAISGGGGVTGGSSYPSTSLPDLSMLFLTASFDWTVKLWSAKVRS